MTDKNCRTVCGKQRSAAGNEEAVLFRLFFLAELFAEIGAALYYMLHAFQDILEIVFQHIAACSCHKRVFYILSGGMTGDHQAGDAWIPLLDHRNQLDPARPRQDDIQQFRIHMRICFLLR